MYKLEIMYSKLTKANGTLGIINLNRCFESPDVICLMPVNVNDTINNNEYLTKSRY